MRFTVTVQPFGFPVTESAHSKSPSARVRFFLGQIDVLVRTLQQVQSPGLNCYECSDFSISKRLVYKALCDKIGINRKSE